MEAELKEAQAALEQYADNDPSRVEAMSARELQPPPPFPHLLRTFC